MLYASNELRSYAGTLRQHGDALRARALEAVTTMESCGWEGVKAQRMTERLRQRQHEVEALASECDTLAYRAELLAQDFDQMVAQMHHAEVQVRSWMAHAAADVVHEFLSASRLPAPGDPRWETVLKQTQRLGSPR